MYYVISSYIFYVFNFDAPTDIYTLSLHDALPILSDGAAAPPRTFLAHDRLATPAPARAVRRLSLRNLHRRRRRAGFRSEEHTSELQSLRHLVCRLLLEKKKRYL